LSICIAAIVELLIVLPNIDHVIHSFCTTQKEYEFFLIRELFWISLRNTAFVAVFFIIAYIEKERTINQNTAKLIIKKYNKIPVSDSRGNPFLLNISQMLYFIKVGNYLQIHTIKGGDYYMYGSLKQLHFLDERDFVRLTRNTSVLGRHIVSFNKESVTLNPSDDDISHTLPIAPSRYEKIEPVLNKFVQKNSTVQDKITKEKHNRKIGRKTTEKPTQSNNPTTPKKDTLNETNLQNNVYQYIVKNPRCTAPKIASDLNIPLRTIQRVIETCKHDGLIEHVGSKKTGGYKTV